MKYHFICALFILSSCSTSINVKKSEIIPVSNRLEGVFYNKAYKRLAKHGVEDDSPTATALSLFDTSHTMKPGTELFRLNFNAKNELVINYSDSLMYHPLALKGKLSKKGYFEIYFHHENIEIPPVIHFLFSRHKILRLRIYETKNNDLLIAYYSYQSGNFLLIGGDLPDKEQFLFHRIK